MISTAEHLRDRLEAWSDRNDMRLFAQGYMERVLGWVRPAAHFTQLRAGWDAAEQDIRQTALSAPVFVAKAIDGEQLKIVCVAPGGIKPA